ncbi:hypothetical protein [Sulfurimonas marina]|uniref:Uncharacterized protein n=1 Tax=Sulfurimonas marina TaxID=2590551 RepID=A0A7M1B098_9BACT|nr:hypothetical protein [Sulfurimonas marina]QOP42062.1 hypothetical protein FJR03_10070 [Sulfurimonas marina]
MKTYYYVHTGHRIGLDRFRRAAAVLSCLDKDITLLCSDFRIAQEARHFGIDKAVGIDVVRNIANIAQKGDQLILDSAEVNPIMLEDMKNFFSKLYVMENDEIVIADKYFEQKEKSVKISYFFGDDDYEKDLMKQLSFVKDLNPHLQLGYYYFLDYEDELQATFENCFEFEDYDDMIMQSEILITASPQAVLESLAAGGKPVYIQRADYTQDFNEKFQELNIPIVIGYDKNKLNETINHINEINYGKIASDCNKFAGFLKENLIL